MNALNLLIFAEKPTKGQQHQRPVVCQLETKQQEHCQNLKKKRYTCLFCVCVCVCVCACVSEGKGSFWKQYTCVVIHTVVCCRNKNQCPLCTKKVWNVSKHLRSSAHEQTRAESVKWRYSQHPTAMTVIYSLSGITILASKVCII